MDYKQKNHKFFIIFTVIVSIIMITSQSQVAFGGAGGFEDKDNDGYSTFEGDCDDTDPNVYPGHGCFEGERSIEIEDDVDDGIVVGHDEIVIISNSATVDGDLQVNGGTVIISESNTIKRNIVSNGGSI